MRITRIRAVIACVLLLASTSSQLAAQTAPQPERPSTPAGPPQTIEPTPIERETPPPERVRHRRAIFRGAQDFTLGPDEVVPEVVSVLGDVTIEGRVQRNVAVVLGRAEIASTAVIEGSLVVVGGSAIVEQGASIQGDLVVVGGTLTAPPTFSPEGEHVVIGTPWLGDTFRGLMPWITHGLLWGRLIVPDLEWIWVFVGILFLVYLVLNLVLDRPVGASADLLVQRPLSAFMTGLLVLLLSVPVLAIVAASVIGLVIVPFLLCALIVAALVGKTAVARAIGRAVVRSDSPDGRVQAFLAFTVGFAVLVLAYMVPILGFVTWALTSVLGLGAAIVTFRSYLRRERQIPPPGSPLPTEPAIAPPVPVEPVPGVVAAAAPPIDRSATAAPLPTAVEVPPPPLPPPPPPAFTQGLAQYPRATFLDRVAAFALDCILVAIAREILGIGDRNDGAFFFLLLLYHIGFWAWRGTTLGGIIVNLRVIRTHGTDLRFVDAVVRGLSGIFSIAALGIGCFWMLQDPERQMWHDKIAGTLVVKVPRALVLP